MIHKITTCSSYPMKFDQVGEVNEVNKVREVNEMIELSAPWCSGCCATSRQ